MTPTNEKLTARYLDILTEYEDLLMNLAQDRHYSKLFLTYAPDGYEQAEHKVFIVGRETRGWGVAFKEGDSLAQYINKSMNLAKSWVESPEGSKSRKRGKGFFTFFHKVANQCGVKGTIWGNTYALSYTTKPDKKPYSRHPRKSKYFGEIEEMSGRLLLAQLEILKPDIVIFAGGGRSVGSRRKYLQQTQGRNLLAQEDFVGVKNRHLWKFELEEDIAQPDSGKRTVCYRINHPSARSKETQAARNYLLKELLPAATR